jgi:hypothetical protein
MVRAWEVGAGGALRLIGEGDVEHGRYAVVVSATALPVVVEASDVLGVPQAKAMVDGDLSPRAQVVLQPLSSQSSLQAAVLLELEREGCHTGDLDRAGLRLRFDDATAQELENLKTTDPLDAAAQVRAFAQAEQTLQLSLRAFISSQGLGWTAWRNARSDVLAGLDRTLTTSTMSPAVAKSQLQLELEQVDAHFGLDPEIAAYGELRTVSAALAALQAQHADRLTPTQVYERNLAAAEARQSAQALDTLLKLGRAPLDVVQQGATVNAVLQRDVAAAEDQAGVVQAFADWRGALRGGLIDGQLSQGLLETWLPGFVDEQQMTGLFTQLATLETELDGTLAIAGGDPGAHFDPQGIATTVDDAWTIFDFGTDRAVQQVTPLDDDHEAAVVSLLIHSQSSFR